MAPASASTGASAPSGTTVAPAPERVAPAGPPLAPQAPPEVEEDLPAIFEHWLHVESSHLLPRDYFECQPERNVKMRAIVVDGLVNVHEAYKMRRETLSLAISFVDRFLARHFEEMRFPLIGVTALFTAAKVEGAFPPSGAEFSAHHAARATGNFYTAAEVIEMELCLLRALDFKVCQPTALHFLDGYCVASGCIEAHREVAQYIMELALIEHSMVRYAPSHLAAGVMLLSNQLMRLQPCWPQTLAHLSNRPYAGLVPLARDLLNLLVNAERHPLQAVRTKFSSSRHLSVATYLSAQAPHASGPARTAAIGGA